MMLTLLALLALPQEDIRVTNDRTVDTRSLESIVRDVVRLSGAESNDEKAIALHTWLHHTIFHCAYPVEKRPQSVGPLKVLNVYGWGLCGGQHTVLKALFETAGWKVRYRGWSSPGHTTVEVFYDGRWHYFDVFLKSYFWTKDRKTIAGQDDIVKDPSIVLDARKEGRVPADHYLCCGDEPAGIVKGCRNSKAHPPAKHENGWASVTGRDRGYAPALSLPPGATLRLEWKGEEGKVAVDGRARHSCGTKDFRSDPVLGPVAEHYGPRGHSNGTLVYAPDLAKPAGVALKGVSPRGGKLVGRGEAVFSLPLPYAWVEARVTADFEGGGTLSVSTDGGATWNPVDSPDVSALVRQKYDVRFRASVVKALAAFRVEAVVQHNRYALPNLLTGDNRIRVEASTRPRDRVTRVTYAWQEATAKPGRSRWDGRGITYGETKTDVREVTSAPAAYTIKVGGNTPPKMLHLEIAVEGR